MKNRAQSEHAITRRRFIATVGAAATVGVGVLRGAARPQPGRRPNLLFIMSDQHRWDFMGCTGHRLVRTPNMDRLASQGALFDAAYCQYPVCVPSRMCIITGRYTHSHGALTNAYALPQDQQTIGGYLKTLGYQTAAIGKMHFVDDDQHHGFDYRLEKLDYGRDTGGEIRNAGTLSRTGESWGISDQTEEQTYEHYLADKTIEWLEQNRDKPFCCWCSFVAPHPPFVAPESLYRQYEGKIRLPARPATPNPFLRPSTQDWANCTDEQALAVMTAYLARITLVDMNLGRVLDALERLHLADNTIVSYTSDHGDMQWQHGRFGKMTMFDGATRIPLILRYGPRVPKGAVRREVVEQVDLYPTFCDLLGVPTPATVQGRSLMPLLEAKRTDWPDTAFIEMGNSVIVRAGRHKGRLEDGKVLELYDLRDDPQEWNNLIGKPEGDRIAAGMSRLADDWRKRTGPDLRGQVSPYKGAAGAAGAREKRMQERSARRAGKKAEDPQEE